MLAAVMLLLVVAVMLVVAVILVVAVKEETIDMVAMEMMETERM